MNGISDEGVVKISEALKINKTLTELDIGSLMKEKIMMVEEMNH